MDRQDFERVVPELRLKLQRIALFYLADDAALHPVLFTECPYIALLSLNNRIHNALSFCKETNCNSNKQKSTTKTY